jgi:hypothetical protein
VNTASPEGVDQTPQQAFTAALRGLNADSVKTLWAKALARRVDDPASAVTLARTLLESVCKHILDDTDTPYPHGRPLPELYNITAKALDIAPTSTTEPTFKTIFEGCAEVVRGVGSLRNFLGDSHGHGETPPSPSGGMRNSR